MMINVISSSFELLADSANFFFLYITFSLNSFLFNDIKLVCKIALVHLMFNLGTKAFIKKISASNLVALSIFCCYFNTFCCRPLGIS